MFHGKSSRVLDRRSRPATDGTLGFDPRTATAFDVWNVLPFGSRGRSITPVLWASFAPGLPSYAPTKVTEEVRTSSGAAQGYGEVLEVEPGVVVFEQYRANPITMKDGRVQLNVHMTEAVKMQDEFGTPVTKEHGLNFMKRAAKEPAVIREFDKVAADMERLETKEIPAVQEKVNRRIDHINSWIIPRLRNLTGDLGLKTIDYVAIGVKGVGLVLKFTPLAPIGFLFSIWGQMIATFGGNKGKMRQIHVLHKDLKATERNIKYWLRVLQGLLNKRNALNDYLLKLDAKFEEGPENFDVNLKIDRVKETPVFRKFEMDPHFIRAQRGIPDAQEIMEAFGKAPGIWYEAGTKKEIMGGGSGMKEEHRLMYVKGEKNPFLIKRAKPKSVDEVKPIGKPVMGKKKAVYGGIFRPDSQLGSSTRPDACALCGVTYNLTLYGLAYR